MINPLRKRHLKVWSVIAMVIPLSIIYVGLVSYSPDSSTVTNSTNLEVTVNDQNIKLRVLQPLKSALSEVYLMSGEGCSSKQFLGTIESIGSYRFEKSQGQICALIVMDALNNTIIESIILK